MQITLHQLELFYYAALHGGFTQAVEELVPRLEGVLPKATETDTGSRIGLKRVRL